MKEKCALCVSTQNLYEDSTTNAVAWKWYLLTVANKPWGLPRRIKAVHTAAIPLTGLRLCRSVNLITVGF